MNKGFTLIELSIVLVIIGLLTGGILVGQSLIASARLQSFVSQMNQLDAAVALFKSNYRYLPGDAGVAHPRYTWGSPANFATQDGLITDDNRRKDSYHIQAAGLDEPALFWYELAVLSGFTPDNCKDLADNTPGSGPNMLQIDGDTCNTGQANLGNNAAIIPYAVDLSAGTYLHANNADGNAYFINDCTTGGTPGTPWIVNHCSGAFTHAEALSYDAKADDGLIGSGEVISGVKSGIVGLWLNGGYTYPAAYDSSNETQMLVIIRRFGEY